MHEELGYDDCTNGMAGQGTLLWRLWGSGAVGQEIELKGLVRDG